MSVNHCFFRFQSLGQKGRRSESSGRLSELHEAGQEEKEEDGQNPTQTVKHRSNFFPL